MKKIIFSLMIIGCAINTNAQSLQIHTGVAFPIGDFADNNRQNDKAGYANTGFNIGLKSYLPLAKSNFSFAFGLDFFLNNLQEEYAKEMYEIYSKLVLHPDYQNYPAYLNIPLTVGLNYNYPLREKKIKIYGEIGIGINCSVITSFYRRNAEWEELFVYYDNCYGLCYNVEGGFLFNWFKLGFRYNYLGNYSYKTNMGYYDGWPEYEYYEAKLENTKRKISNLQLVIGFNF